MCGKDFIILDACNSRNGREQRNAVVAFNAMSALRDVDESYDCF